MDRSIHDNAFELAKYVFLKPETSKENRRTIRKYKGVVHNFLKFSERARPLYSAEGKVTALIVISCLQVITSDEDKLHFDNKYYGYQGIKGARKSPQHLKSAFKSGFADDALQIYLVRKVIDRWYANIGRCNSRNKLRDFENACDAVLLKILALPNIYEMLRVHSLYMKEIYDGFGDIATRAAHDIAQHLLDKGFGYIDIGYKIRDVFLCSCNIAKTYEAIISLIDNTINDGEIDLHITCEPIMKDHGEEKETGFILYDFKLNFDYEYNICTFDDLNF